MRTGLATWLTYAATALVGGVLALNGCTPDGDTINNIGGDSGVPTVGDSGIPQRCTPAAKECVTPSLARICPADGSDWAEVRCLAGEKCDAGECKADPNATCKLGQGSCLNPTTALRCRATLAGFEQIACPASTTCTGDGLCQGACVVGSSKCLPDGSVATCADGKTYTPTACAAGQLCVSTGTAPMETAACKAAECTPSANPGCGAVCGNKTNTAADQTKFTSTCVETPAGYKWAATGCLAPTTCTPNSVGCPGGAQASCTSECVPGQMRCSANQLGSQTCGADGKWAAAITNCNANAGAGALLCMPKPDDPNKVVCGDPICDAGAVGTCQGVQIRACGNDGKLGAAANCPAGTGQCVATGGAIGGVTLGACQAQCQAGDERCSSTTGFQTCVNGLWSTPQTCPAAAGTATCTNFTSTLGRPAKICNAVCAPGTQECRTVTTGNDSIRTCSATGTWSADTACAVGVCQNNAGGGGSAACIAQCIPGSLMCMGGARAVAGTEQTGTDSVGTCTAAGKLPAAPVACGAGLACRKGIGGNAIVVGGNACLECVGSAVAGGNEIGQVDTRCSNAGGTAGGTDSTQLCGAANTWAGATTSCSAIGKTCTALAGVCQNHPRRGGTLRNNTYFVSRGRGGCVGAGRGTVVQCGTTSDCCSAYCSNVSSGAACR